MNNFSHHCPGTPWKFLCWSPHAVFWLCDHISNRLPLCPRKPPPLSACVFPVNRFFLSFDMILNSHIANVFLLTIGRGGGIGFFLPALSDLLKSVSLFWEESSRCLSQALSIRLIDRQAGPWHGTVSFASACRTKAGEAGSVWLRAYPLWYSALWFLTKEGRNYDKTKEGRIYFSSTSQYLVPIAKMATGL